VIERVGKRDGLKPDGRPLEVFDFGERAILPGFSDVHAHLEMASLSLYNTVDCHTPPRSSIDDILQALSENKHLAESWDGWLIGQGNLMQDQRLRERRLPTRVELDRVSRTMPIAIRLGWHTTILNTAAMERSRIGSGLEIPRGGVVEVDEAGQPNGVVREIQSALPLPRADARMRREAILQGVSRHWLANGVTSVGEIFQSRDALPVFDDLVSSSQLPLRLALFPWIPWYGSVRDTFAHLRTVRLRSDPSRLRIQGVKLFSDGGYSSATAAIRRPYAHRKGSRGLFAITRREVAAAIALAREQGLQVIVHTNGERAQDMVCAVVAAQGGSSAGRTRVRLEHAGNFVSGPTTFEHWRASGALPVPNPMFLYTIGSFLPVYLGEYARRGRFPFRTLIDQGWLPAGNSDTSGDDTQALNPFFVMWCAIKRETFSGELIEPEHALTIDEALRMYTIWAAEATGEGEIKGTLEPGKLADLIVLERDPYACSPDELKNIRVDHVVIGGQLVHSRSGAQPPQRRVI
jgi:predicted amidohydrolase YtcJ